MNRRKNLVALGGAEHGSAGNEGTDVTVTFGPAAFEGSYGDAEAPAVDDVWMDGAEEETASSGTAWLVPLLAFAAIGGWTGFYGWSHLDAFTSGATPREWSTLVSEWAVPVLLVVGLWLLAMRNSTREANRFGSTAQMLANESRALEQRLVSVNAELSLARDFIAAQSRDLESLGRVASERLSANADRLQSLIRDNGDQVNAIGEVSDTALTNMDKLRDRLPVIANAARDLTSQIGHAGNTAQDQLAEMIAAFQRLNEFGTASGRQVVSLRDSVAGTIADFEARLADLDQQTQSRFNRLREQDEEFRQDLEAREIDALASLRRRAQELAEEVAALGARNSEREVDALAQLHQRLADLRQGQEHAETRWTEALRQMQANLAEAINEISRIDEAAVNNARSRIDALAAASLTVDSSIADSMAAFEEEHARRRSMLEVAQSEAVSALKARIAAFDTDHAARRAEHVLHMEAMAVRAETLAARLAELDGEMARLTGQGSEEARRLGAATAEFTARLVNGKATLDASNTAIQRLTDDSVRLLELIRASADHSEGVLSQSIAHAESRLNEFARSAHGIDETVGAAEAKGLALAQHLAATGESAGITIEALSAVEDRLTAMSAQAAALATQSREDLQDALSSLEQASTEMVARLREGQAEAVRAVAERLGSEGSTILADALQSHTTEAVARLQEAANTASEQGRATTMLLRDQLSKVNALAGNLEQRVEQARARAEEQVNSDFTRRMALITESLNSCSIDITRALDAEVTDTAWASYLRGDRGIFTRRAVRLLDGHEVRSIADAYDGDAAMREAINRYIHDFEALLRPVLSTRDGNALAVTLLSSDIGKLYVVLAQAIERLRD
jgi:hypothetical protein